MSDDSGAAKTTRTESEVRADIAAGQQQLADTVDALVDRANPKAIASRTVAEGKDRLHDQLYDNDGTLRTRKIASVGGAVVAAIGLLVTVRVLLSRRRREGRRR